MTQETLEQAYTRWDEMTNAAGRRPSPLDALKQSTWVYSAVTLISEGLSRTPLAGFSRGRRVEDHPILRFVAQPNNYSDQNTSAKFRYAYQMELLLHGAAMRLLSDFQGFRPGRMTVRPRWQFRCEYATDQHARQVPVRWMMDRVGGSATYYEGDTCYHDGLYNPLHDFEGLSPLTAALLSVANDTDISEFAHRFFENDGSTGLVFSTDNPAFTQAKADDACKKWKAAHSGLSNAFSAKFVGFGLKPTAIGTPLDAKMLQILRSFTREEIVCGIYKVPLEAISSKETGGDIVIGGPSGGTQASAREGLLINVVMPWAARYDEEFDRDVTWRFGGGIYLQHDFTADPILERRRLERAKAAVELIDRGVPLNEVIHWLHLEIEVQPWGDDWWVKNDRLPARVVLDAGPAALKIAIPDPVEPQRKKSQDQYVGEIVALATSHLLAESVRHDPAVRHNGTGKTNRQRILEILSVSRGTSAGSGAGSDAPAPRSARE